jgi:hypothetical protein
VATLVLSAVGKIIGGPVGQAIGAVIGSQIDRAIIGGPKSKREGPRLADLAVQTASYGEPLPILYGKCRIAGNLVWSSGLIERSSTQTSGSRKSGRTTTTSYSYFASFAVALTGREILRVERIWADGKLIRGQSGDGLSVGGQVRIYTGGEAQEADALLEAALPPDYAPHNRGVSYAVFEELPLVEFANRIPNLTFEIVADESVDCTHGFVAADLARRAAVRDVEVRGLDQPCEAVLLADGSGVRTTLDALSALTPLKTIATEAGLLFAAYDSSAPAQITAREVGAGNANAETSVPLSRQRVSALAMPSEIEIRHIDQTRDYQAGIQRARRTTRGAKRQIDLPVVMDSSRAKRISETVLARVWRERDSLTVRVPLTRLDIRDGDSVTVDGHDSVWRVDSRVLEEGALTLTLLPLRLSDNDSQATADGGVPIVQVIDPHGPTVAHVLDLPPLENALPTSGRLVIAAAGASKGWRQASLWQSADGGNTYADVATVTGATHMGVALTALAAAPPGLWDERNSVDIEMLSDADDLLSRSEADVLSGVNLALLGSELVQFRTVEPITGKHFRLRGLLRGRRGSERHVSGHQSGERFVLLDPLPAARVVPPLGLLGQTLLYKPLSPQEGLGAVPAQPLIFQAQALRPLSPVHLKKTDQANGDTLCQWTRRSRAGFDWLDGIDAPLAEENERYQVSILSNGTVLRDVTVTTPSYVYPAVQRLADQATGTLTLCVRQVSAQVGTGADTILSL